MAGTIQPRIYKRLDKETQKEVSRNVKAFLDTMRKTWQFLPQHFVTSAVKKLGRKQILEAISDMNKEQSE
jgi:hypothetical protein